MQERPKNKLSKKIFLTITLSVIGLSGLILSFFIILGGGDRGVMTALIILLADVYLIVGFFARHLWLRNTTWGLTLYMLAVSILMIWWDGDIVIREKVSYCPDTIYGVCAPVFLEWSEVVASLMFGAMILAGFSVIASIISFTWKRIQDSDWARRLYYAVLSLFGLSGVIYAFAIMESTLSDDSNWSNLSNYGTAALVMGSTGAATLIVVSIALGGRKTAVIESPAPVSSEVDFRSPEAREAFYEFMKEYEFSKTSSFNLPVEEVKKNEEGSGPVV